MKVGSPRLAISAMKGRSLILALLILIAGLLLMPVRAAHAYPVPPLPPGNLISNPWFRSASDPSDPGLDSWVLVYTNGVSWGPSQKSSNPSPDPLVGGKCGSAVTYCGTAARWAEQKGVLYPNIDVFAYQVVATDPANRKLTFFTYFVSHRVDLGAVNIYGGASPDGPWEHVWTPLYHSQAEQIVPESGEIRDLWLETGLREKVLENGLPYYKVELQARLPELPNGMIRGAGFKVTGVYFTTAFTDAPAGSEPIIDDAEATAQPEATEAAGLPSDDAGSEPTAEAAAGESAEPPRATEIAGQPTELQSVPSLSAEAISATEIAIALDSSPSAGLRLTLEHSEDGTTGWRPLTRLRSSDAQYVAGGLLPDTVHYYRVRGSDDTVSNIVFARTPALQAEAVLAAPASLQVELAAAQGGVMLSWTDLSDDEFGFVIERSQDRASFETIGIVSKDVTSFEDTASIPGQYYYRVRSYRNDDYSEPSDVVDVTIEGGVATAVAEVPAETAPQTQPVNSSSTSQMTWLAGALAVSALLGLMLLFIWRRRSVPDTAASEEDQGQGY